jgi:pyruvate ferredoxin oxidoreductase gamma subunit
MGANRTDPAFIPKAVELRFHGRGGQGTVTLAALATDAAVASGWHALGFPAFGPERTGAPVQAFLRLSRSPIRDRSEVTEPHVVVVQDSTLLGSVDVTAGIRDGGLVLVNADAPPDLGGSASWDVASLRVSEIANRHLGSAHTSTAMLGFLARATGWFDRNAVVDAIERRFAGDVASRNRAAALDAYSMARQMPPRAGVPARKASASRSGSPLGVELSPGLVAKPGTSVANHTGGWRTEVPRFLRDRCTGCDLCAVFCPEGIVFRVDRRIYDFDPDYCKGCGICVAECPTGDIVMEAVTR